jgi:hypothetical protein
MTVMFSSITVTSTIAGNRKPKVSGDVVLKPISEFKLNLIWEFTPKICGAELNVHVICPALSLFYSKLKEHHSS